MMAFITRCCKKNASALSHLLRGLLLCLALITAAHAGNIEPKEASLSVSDEGYVLAADFTIDIGARLDDILTRGGVPLYFKLEFVLERPRKYWVAEHVVNRSLTFRLSYSSLTRQYRVSNGALHLSYATLDEALRGIGRVSAFPVADKGSLVSGETYEAAVRLSLDRSQLPKPFQLDAITDKEWQMSTKTLRWKLPAPTITP